MYGYYAYVYFTEGKAAKGASASAWTGKTIEGSAAGKAAIIGFSGAVMTLSKSVLYCKFAQSDQSKKIVIVDGQQLNGVAFCRAQ